jgi:hypothetical protein
LTGAASSTLPVLTLKKKFTQVTLCQLIKLLNPSDNYRSAYSTLFFIEMHYYYDFSELEANIELSTDKLKYLYTPPGFCHNGPFSMRKKKIYRGQFGQSNPVQIILWKNGHAEIIITLPTFYSRPNASSVRIGL